MTDPRLYVTRPALPALDEFIPLLQEIWASRILTNGGPFHARLESALCEYLGVPHVSLCTNATLGLMIALRSACPPGEIITTPYSFVATSHVIRWTGSEPVFVDVEPDTLNIDASRVEAAITPRTTGILAVHCYGNPCAVTELEALAERHGIPLVYDAAHAFGARVHQRSLMSYGDLSVVSFHATKIFNTLEGGAIVCKDAATKLKIDRLKNFGFVNETSIAECGLNAKMSEINAALGLLQLKTMPDILERRADIGLKYRLELQDVVGIDCITPGPHTVWNHAYFPIMVRETFGMSRDALYEKMKQAGVHCRRYFHPLISDLEMYRSLPSADPARLPVASAAGNQVLCLPIYPDLSPDDQSRVIALIRGDAD